MLEKTKCIYGTIPKGIYNYLTRNMHMLKTEMDNPSFYMSKDKKEPLATLPLFDTEPNK